MVLFLLLVFAISAGAETVDIIRDAYGSPHIFATTAAGAAYGAGYAQAEDRPDALLHNLTPSATDSQPLPEPVHAIAEAYAKGVNRYFSEHPERQALPVTATQVAAFAQRAYTWIKGSNDLVVGRTRSASRFVIAVLDPLADWNAPDRPYEMTLYASKGDLSIAGVAPVGMPFPVVGHSQYVTVGWSPENPREPKPGGARALEEAWALISARSIVEVHRALSLDQIPGHVLIGTSGGDIYDSAGSQPTDGYLRRKSPSAAGDAVAKEQLRIQHTWSFGRIQNLAFWTEVYKADTWQTRLAHSMPQDKFARRLAAWNRMATPDSAAALAFYEFKMALGRDSTALEPPESLSDARLRAVVDRAQERVEAQLDYNSTFGTLFRTTREGSHASYPIGGGNIPEAGMETPRSFQFSPPVNADARAIHLSNVGPAATRIVELSTKPEAVSVLSTRGCRRSQFSLLSKPSAPSRLDWCHETHILPRKARTRTDRQFAKTTDILSRVAALPCVDQDLRPVIEQFLAQARLPVAIEPGDDPIPLDPGHFAVSGTALRPLFECWSDTRTLARRISAIHSQKRGKLELATEQFGGRKGTLLLVDLAHPANSSATRGGDRLKFREQFRLALRRQYPDWKVVEISTAPDLEHSLSPAYPRALLRKGTLAMAAIGAPEHGADPDGALAFGLIWLDYLRRREPRLSIGGLLVFLPIGAEINTCHRVRYLDSALVKVAVFVHGHGTLEEAVNAADYNNFATHVQPLHARPIAHHRGQPEAELEQLVRANIRRVDGTLLESPLYNQAPEITSAHRGILDLLAVDFQGRLAIIEIKASEDLHLPLQALDYWMRVKWHLERGDFARAGYFPGISVRPEAAAAHPTCTCFPLPSHQRNHSALLLARSSRGENRARARMEAGTKGRLSPMLFRQLKNALTNLNPSEVRAEAARPVRIGLIASSPAVLGRMEAYLAPAHLSPERRTEALRSLIRGTGNCDIVLCESSLLVPAGAFPFDLESPEQSIRVVLAARKDLMLPLARLFYPFRKPASQRIVRNVAKENALFCLATAVPDVVPFLSLPWAIGEYGSDSVFLTANQIRMVFLLAAANDRAIGYSEQRSEIASITASSFGWRALARELIGKIPFGGGLIPKAAVGWAGTFALGLSIERLYRLGYGFSRAERSAVYKEAFKHGKEVAGLLLENFSRRKKTA